MALIIVFQNDQSGTDTAANYKVTVQVNDRVIARARVEGHDRAAGWQSLLARLAPAVEHRCGVRGFVESGDQCPGCVASGRV